MTLFLGGAAASEDWGDGVDVVPLRFDPRSRVRRVLAEQTLLPRAVRDSAPDLLHNLFNTAPAVTSVPQVTTIHDVIHRHPDSGLLALGLKAAFPAGRAALDRILTVSEASKTDIVRFLGVACRSNRRRAERAGDPRGRRGLAPDEVRRRFEIGDAPLVLTVAPSRPHKNVPRLVEALALLPDAVWSFPDTRPEATQSSTTLAEQLGVADRLRRPGLGRRGDARRALPGGRLLRLSLARRGLRAPGARGHDPWRTGRLLERHLAPEVAGEAALYFDPTDVEAIAVSVQRLLEDEELADELRAAGLERAKRFSWDESRRGDARLLSQGGRATSFGIDARAAAEEPAGRGRYVRELLTRPRPPRRRPRLRAVRADRGTRRWTSAFAGA